MDIIKLYQDMNVPYWTEGKNVSPGWVNVQCPWCGDLSNHLGFNIDKQYYRCWKCGWHPTVDTLQRILNVERATVQAMFKVYGDAPTAPRRATEVRIRTKAHKLPSNTGPLTKAHKRYLIGRQFDVAKLEKEWGLLGTGPISHLDGISFNRRIIIPIYWDGKRVSFQARDITGTHPLRYISCPKPRELVHHKHILYGRQQDWTDEGICVEGVTDVWRLGLRAFATFGIEYTHSQVKEIAKQFKRVIVLFDEEKQAQIKAKQLVSELRTHGVHARREVIKGDPGSLAQQDANKLVSQLLGG